MNAASKEFDGFNKYIRITDIDEETAQYRIDNIVSPDCPLDEKYLVKSNDILFARTGASTGKTYLYSRKDGKMFFAGFLIRANVNIEHDASFIFYQTQINRYKRWVNMMSARSGQPGINSWIERASRATRSGAKKPPVAEWNVPRATEWNEPCVMKWNVPRGA